MSDPTSSRLVVMTGATSGLGAHAVRAIAAQPGTRVIVGARGTPAVPDGVEVLPLDLSALANVRQFADAVVGSIGDASIDLLVLNAGMQPGSNEQRSPDGFELTFAVNHLAHYLLVRLLAPRMAEGGRIVITTSSTHDPKNTPIAPKTLVPEELAHPPKKGAGVRAYSASKLCNLMTAEWLAGRDEVTSRHVSVVAFNPGLTGGTGLGREGSAVSKFVVNLLMNTVFRVVGMFRPEYVRSTAERSGEQLARIALGEINPPAGNVYVSLVKGEATFPAPSELARDRAKQEQLWNESAAMVGLN